jgi:hypothetical protein
MIGLYNATSESEVDEGSFATVLVGYEKCRSRRDYQGPLMRVTGESR